MGLWSRIFGRFADAAPSPRAIPASYVNEGTGAGTGLDKAGGGFYRHRYWDRYSLEAVAEQSWAARKVIHIPVLDAFSRWREWEEQPDEMVEYEKELEVRELFRRLMLVGRQYGTALAFMVTKEDMFTEPLDVERIREGDLLGVTIMDRYDATIVEWGRDPLVPDEYGKPTLYQLNPRYSGTSMQVHHSRILRYDGVERHILEFDGTRQWGNPVIQHVIDAVVREDAAAGAAAHLMEQANVRVITVGDEAQDQLEGKDTRVREQIQASASAIGVRRTVVLPEGSDLKNETYSFAGVKDLLQTQSMRIAAAADIPYTRFMGKSPDGMNATGHSDDVNYARMIRAEQERLTQLLDRYDEVALRSFGFAGDIPAYAFPDLTETSDSDKAAAELAKVQALDAAYRADALGAEEMRERLSGGPVFGDLSGPPPEDTASSKAPDLSMEMWPEDEGGDGSPEEDEED